MLCYQQPKHGISHSTCTLAFAEPYQPEPYNPEAPGIRSAPGPRAPPPPDGYWERQPRPPSVGGPRPPFPNQPPPQHLLPGMRGPPPLQQHPVPGVVQIHQQPAVSGLLCFKHTRIHSLHKSEPSCCVDTSVHPLLSPFAESDARNSGGRLVIATKRPLDPPQHHTYHQRVQQGVTATYPEGQDPRPPVAMDGPPARKRPFDLQRAGEHV